MQRTLLERVDAFLRQSERLGDALDHHRRGVGTSRRHGRTIRLEAARVEGAQAGAQGSALPTIGGGEIVQGDWRPAALGRAEAHKCGARDSRSRTAVNPACTAIERAESAPEAQLD